MSTEHGNVGHGHVYPRPDGLVARCGGPGLGCPSCVADQSEKAHEPTWSEDNVRPRFLRENHVYRLNYIDDQHVTFIDAEA